MEIKILTLSELQPGMILGQPINDQNGRTIVQEGARLTPMYIKRLDKWGITEVRIQTVDIEALDDDERKAHTTLHEATEEERGSMRALAGGVQKRFANVQGNPVMDELKRLTVRHLVLNDKGAIPGTDS